MNSTFSGRSAKKVDFGTSSHPLPETRPPSLLLLHFYSAPARDASTDILIPYIRVSFKSWTRLGHCHRKSRQESIQAVSALLPVLASPYIEKRENKRLCTHLSDFYSDTCEILSKDYDSKYVKAV
jgi:hypothetical protein